MCKIKQLHIDIETFSSVELSKCGVYKYAESDDFEILLFGYSCDGNPVRVVDVAMGECIPQEIIDAIKDTTVIKYAHNAAFERVCLSRYLGYEQGKYLSPENWRCTMVWSSATGLPLSLSGVGSVLGLEKQKLTEGKDLIRYFCVPCKPTLSNGSRTRNMPHADMQKWSLFKAYNKRDVEVEMQIMQKLSRFPLPEFLWKEFELDQEINDRGIRVDISLVSSAITLDAITSSKLTTELKAITGLDNPNSVMQLKGWLKEQGVVTDTLGKKQVQALIEEHNDIIGRVLKLRLMISKSSVKKYTAMQNCACADNRLRGMFMFYGASRTGRWSGRNVQLQNLRRNNMAELSSVRELVKNADYSALDMLYSDIPDVLSQLVRTAFVPYEGGRFFVADFSAIEARVLAWLAGEVWKLTAFAEGKDIYCATASKMFGVPVEKHGANAELRQKGKQAELACIAEGQLVLTDKGLVPIEKVTEEHLLWDGESWVHHDGVIYKGEREVITYEGLRATPDHYVWVEGQQRPIQFGDAASCGAHLVQTGDGRNAIRLGKDNIPGKEMEREVESLLCSDTMYRLRKHTMAESEESAKREIKRLSGLLTAENDSAMARQTHNGGEATLYKPQECRVSQLWWTRNKIRVRKRSGGRAVSDRKIRFTGQVNGTRQNRHQWQLCSGESEVCNAYSEQSEQAKHSPDSLRAEVLAVLIHCGNKETVGRSETRGHNRGCKTSCGSETKTLANHISKARLYDIRNAGGHHRFTVSDKLVHNCGYGGATGALIAMGAVQNGLSEDELPELVQVWRDANPKIVRLWYDIERAAKKTVKEHVQTQTHGLTFSYESGIMFIALPSGRRIAYPKPRIGENIYGNEAITYEGTVTGNKWSRIETFGGKLTENITQAIARDILAYALTNLRGYAIVAHVHDEVIIEAPAETSLDEICKIMGQTPPWAKGLPLRADGYVCDFYMKD